MPSIEWSVSLGSMLHLVGIIVAGVAGWVKLAGRLDRLEAEIARAPKIEDFKVVQSQLNTIWEWFTTRLERRGEAR